MEAVSFRRRGGTVAAVINCVLQLLLEGFAPGFGFGVGAGLAV